MRFDLSPLYRSTVGFDRVFNLLDGVNDAQGQSYPPYNIERLGENDYRITMAVAGFAQKDISIESRENALTISGKQPEETKRNYLHQGIAGRAFERRFVLADHIVVEGADLANGLLHVALKHVVPEALKPRRVPVQGGRPAIEAQPETAQAA